MTYAEPHSAARPSYRGRAPRPARYWRRVVVAAAMLAFLGAGVGTAFGLAGKAQNPPADPAALSATTTPEPDPDAETESPEPQASDQTQPSATATKNPGGGHQTVAVPHVVGLDEKDARSRIEERHLKAKVVYVCSGHESPGKVTAQDPRGDTSVTAGRTVSIEVQGVEVPDVVGEAHAYAKSRLQDEGLTVTVSHKPTADVDPGKVVGQSPAAGTCVKRGSPVALTVAQAPADPSTEPSITS